MKLSLYNQRFLTVFLLVFAAALFSGSEATAQSSSNADSLIPRPRDERNLDQPKVVREYLAKQKAEKEKKEHEELLKRGEEIATLTGELETAFERTNQLSSSDRAKLDSLEKLVSKVRKELGADDEGDEDDDAAMAAEPSSVKEAFSVLKRTAADLVEELKKSTRFTISALAIQSSNSVLKVIRFLRIRK